MVKELIKFSLTGWNIFFTGSSKQKFIAYVALGAIEGGTRTLIESVTGIRKKRKEEAMRREKELESKLEELKIDIANDFRKQVEEAFEETRQNIESTKDIQREAEKILKELDN